VTYATRARSSRGLLRRTAYPTQSALVRTGSSSSLVRGFRPLLKGLEQKARYNPRCVAAVRMSHVVSSEHSSVSQNVHIRPTPHPTDGPCMHLSVAVPAYPAAAWSDAIGDLPSMEPTRAPTASRPHHAIADQ
jgi:hypothetical protein